MDIQPNESQAPGHDGPGSVENLQAQAFYSGALNRITHSMVVLAVVATVGVWLRFGWSVGVGFGVGSVIAYVNFHWLKRVVIALADEVTKTGKQQSGKGIVLRFMLRYGLVAAGCYVIFRVSVASMFGLLAGLFLPVGGIACEAAYEVYVALRRGI